MKVGIIGTGSIAEKIVRVFERISEVEVLCVYSRTLEKGKQFALKFNIGRVYNDLNEMLCNKDLDLIYISSPNSVHKEQIIASLLADKDVICEKPMVLTKKDAEEMFTLAKNKKHFLLEAITVPFMPNYKILQSQKLDDIHLVSCDLSQYSSRYTNLKEGNVSNVFDTKMGGGALYDLGVYCLHFMYGLFGKPLSLTGISRYYRGVDTSGVILMKYTDMCGVLTYGKDTVGKNETKLQGEKGYYLIEGPCSRVKTCTWVQNEISHTLGKSIDEQHHIYEMESFVRIIKNKDYFSQEKLWKQSLAVAEMVDQIKREQK